MKRILLIAFAIGCIMTASAQQTRQNYDYTQKLDSVVYGGVSLVASLDYDGQGNAVKVSFTSMGITIAYIEYQYDSQNRLISTLANFDDDLSKTEYTYNYAGLLATVMSYVFEDEVWVPVIKTDYEYNNNGDLYTVTEQNYYDDEWINSTQKANTYLNGKLITQTYSFWDSSYDEWEAVEETILTYEDDLCVQKLIKENNYDSSDAWDDEVKTIYEYDSYGNYIKETNYDYEDEEGVWVIKSEIGYTYDVTVPANAIAGFDLMLNDNEFVSVNAKVLKIDEQYYDDGVVTDHLENYMHYSAWNNVGEVNGNAMYLWPNPTTATLNIGNAEIQQADIFSIDGRHVMRALDTQSIDVRKLASGSYLLKATTKNGQITTQPFLKK